MNRLKTKDERDAQFERIAWRIAAKRGFTIEKAKGHLLERLSVGVFRKVVGDIVEKDDPNPYAYESRTCVCSICGTNTRIDGTDCLSMSISTPAVPWEMLVGTVWGRSEEVCLSCVKGLPDKWRKLFQPPFTQKG